MFGGDNMKKVIAAMVVFALLVGIGGLASAHGMEGGSWAKEKWGEHWDENAAKIAKKCNMFGWISYDPSTGYAEGRYISFYIDEDQGTITEYTLNNTTVFNKVYFDSTVSWGDVYVHGAALIYYSYAISGEFNYSHGNFSWNVSGYARIVGAHDNPTGVMSIMLVGNEINENVHYVLADGLTASFVNNYHIKITGNGINAHLLIGHGTANINGNEITINIQKAGCIVFVAKPPNSEIPDEAWDKIMEGIQKGKVAAQVKVAVSGEAYAADSVNYTHEVSVKVEKAQKNSVRVKVSGYASTGKAVYVEVNKDSLNGDIKVIIDGKEAKRVDVETALNGGNEPMYAVIEGKSTVGIIVWVPHFSEHTVDIKAESASPFFQNYFGLPLYLWIIIAVVVIVIVAVVAAKRR